MITDIRKQFANPAYKSILWITILSVAGAFSLPTLFRNIGSGGPWAIRVNKEEISVRDFVQDIQEKREMLANVRARYGQYADALLQSMGLAPDPKALAFESLVREEIIDQVGHKIGIQLNEDFIANNMNNASFVGQHLANLVPPFAMNPNGGVNRRILADVLKRRGMSIAAFERRLERTIMQRVVTDLLATTYYTPEFDLKQYYTANYPNKKFSYIRLPLEDFVAQEQKYEITPEELKEFYDIQNKKNKRYYVPEKRAGLKWVFTPASYGIKVTDDEIEAFYLENKIKRFIDTPTRVEVRMIQVKAVPGEAAQAQARIASLREQVLANPTRFTDLAREHSDDTQTAQNGGLMPAFSRGELENKQLERASFILKNDGDVSEIIQTSDGYALVQRVSKTMQQFKSLASVRNEIISLITERDFKRNFVRDIKAMIENSDNQDAAIQRFVSKRGGSSEKIEPAVRDDSQEMQHLFRMNVGEYAFFVDGDEGVALKLTTANERYLPTLEAIEGTIKSDLYEERARRTQRKTLEEMQKEVATRSLNSIAQDHNAQVASTEWVNREDRASTDELREAGLPIQQMLQMEKTGSTIAHEGDDAAYLISLKEIEQLPADQMADKMGTARNELDRQRMMQLSEGFIASLFRNATIETNESLATTSEDYSI